MVTIVKNKVTLKNWIRTSVILTLISFIVPIISWAFDGALYVPINMSVSAVIHHGQQLGLPKQCGTIEETFQGQRKTVVVIDDLHCNYEVQMNIAKMIDHLAQNNNLQLVGEEGAFGSVDVSSISGFKNRHVRQLVTDYFVKQGKITGAEYYAITGKKSVMLEGIENEQLYRSNQQAVQGFLNSESLGLTYDLRDIFDQLKVDLYNNELKKHDAKWSAYYQGNMDLLRFALYLHKVARKKSIPLTQFQQLSDYLHSKDQTITPSIKVEGLYKDIESIDRLIRKAMYTHEIQKKLDQRYHKIMIIEKLLNISATPEELAQFRENREQFNIAGFTIFIEQVNNRSSANYHEVMSELTALDDYLKQVDRFYQVADERSDAFVNNIIHKMEKYQESLALIVTGGFHRDKILEQLKLADISYIAVRPKLTRLDVINPYFDILQGNKNPLEILLEKNQTIFANEIVFPNGTLQPHQSLFQKLSKLYLRMVNYGEIRGSGVYEVEPDVTAVAYQSKSKAAVILNSLNALTNSTIGKFKYWLGDGDQLPETIAADVNQLTIWQTMLNKLRPRVMLYHVAASIVLAVALSILPATLPKSMQYDLAEAKPVIELNVSTDQISETKRAIDNRDKLGVTVNDQDIQALAAPYSLLDNPVINLDKRDFITLYKASILNNSRDSREIEHLFYVRSLILAQAQRAGVNEFQHHDLLVNQNRLRHYVARVMPLYQKDDMTGVQSELEKIGGEFKKAASLAATNENAETLAYDTYGLDQHGELSINNDEVNGLWAQLESSAITATQLDRRLKGRQEIIAILESTGYGQHIKPLSYQELKADMDSLIDNQEAYQSHMERLRIRLTAYKAAIDRPEGIAALAASTGLDNYQGFAHADATDYFNARHLDLFFNRTEVSALHSRFIYMNSILRLAQEQGIKITGPEDPILVKVTDLLESSYSFYSDRIAQELRKATSTKEQRHISDNTIARQKATIEARPIKHQVSRADMQQLLRTYGLWQNPIIYSNLDEYLIYLTARINNAGDSSREVEHELYLNSLILAEVTKANTNAFQVVDSLKNQNKLGNYRRKLQPYYESNDFAGLEAELVKIRLELQEESSQTAAEETKDVRPIIPTSAPLAEVSNNQLLSADMDAQERDAYWGSVASNVFNEGLQFVDPTTGYALDHQDNRTSTNTTNVGFQLAKLAAAVNVGNDISAAEAKPQVLKVLRSLLKEPHQNGFLPNHLYFDGSTASHIDHDPSFSDTNKLYVGLIMIRHAYPNSEVSKLADQLLGRVDWSKLYDETEKSLRYMYNMETGIWWSAGRRAQLASDMRIAYLIAGYLGQIPIKAFDLLDQYPDQKRLYMPLMDGLFLPLGPTLESWTDQLIADQMDHAISQGWPVGLNSSANNPSGGYAASFTGQNRSIVALHAPFITPWLNLSTELVKRHEQLGLISPNKLLTSMDLRTGQKSRIQIDGPNSGMMYLGALNQQTLAKNGTYGIHVFFIQALENFAGTQKTKVKYGQYQNWQDFASRVWFYKGDKTVIATARAAQEKRLLNALPTISDWKPQAKAQAKSMRAQVALSAADLQTMTDSHGWSISADGGHLELVSKRVGEVAIDFNMGDGYWVSAIRQFNQPITVPDKITFELDYAGDQGAILEVKWIVGSGVYAAHVRGLRPGKQTIKLNKSDFDQGWNREAPLATADGFSWAVSNGNKRKGTISISNFTADGRTIGTAVGTRNDVVATVESADFDRTALTNPDNWSVSTDGGNLDVTSSQVGKVSLDFDMGSGYWVTANQQFDESVTVPENLSFELDYSGDPGAILEVKWMVGSGVYAAHIRGLQPGTQTIELSKSDFDQGWGNEGPLETADGFSWAISGGSKRKGTISISNFNADGRTVGTAIGTRGDVVATGKASVESVAFDATPLTNPDNWSVSTDGGKYSVTSSQSGEVTMNFDMGSGYWVTANRQFSEPVTVPDKMTFQLDYTGDAGVILEVKWMDGSGVYAAHIRGLQPGTQTIEISKSDFDQGWGQDGPLETADGFSWAVSGGGSRKGTVTISNITTVGGISRMLQVAYGWLFQWLHGGRQAAEAFYAARAPELETMLFGLTAGITFYITGDLLWSTLAFWGPFRLSHIGSQKENSRLATILAALNLGLILPIISFYHIQSAWFLIPLLLVAYITHKVMNWYVQEISKQKKQGLIVMAAMPATIITIFYFSQIILPTWNQYIAPLLLPEINGFIVSAMILGLFLAVSAALIYSGLWFVYGDVTDEGIDKIKKGIAKKDDGPVVDSKRKFILIPFAFAGSYVADTMAPVINMGQAFAGSAKQRLLSAGMSAADKTAYFKNLATRAYQERARFRDRKTGYAYDQPRHRSQTNATNVGFDLVQTAVEATISKGISRGEATAHIRKVLDKLEKEPTLDGFWPNHLNINGRTNAPSNPQALSDTNKLAVGLIIVAHAFKGTRVSSRAYALLEKMDWSKLYDRSTGKLKYEFNLTTGKWTGNPGGTAWLGSDVRIAYIIAAALGKIPVHALNLLKGRPDEHDFGLFMPGMDSILLDEAGTTVGRMLADQAWHQIDDAINSNQPLAGNSSSNNPAGGYVGNFQGANKSIVSPHAAALLGMVYPDIAVELIKRYEALGVITEDAIYDAYDNATGRVSQVQLSGPNNAMFHLMMVNLGHNGSVRDLFANAMNDLMKEQGVRKTWQQFLTEVPFYKRKSDRSRVNRTRETRALADLPPLAGRASVSGRRTVNQSTVSAGIDVSTLTDGKGWHKSVDQNATYTLTETTTGQLNLKYDFKNGMWVTAEKAFNQDIPDDFEFNFTYNFKGKRGAILEVKLIAPDGGQFHYHLPLQSGKHTVSVSKRDFTYRWGGKNKSLTRTKSFGWAISTGGQRNVGKGSVAINKVSATGGISRMLQVAYGWLFQWLHGDRAAAEAFYTNYAPEIETAIFGIVAGIFYFNTGDLYTAFLIFWSGLMVSHIGSSWKNFGLASLLTAINVMLFYTLIGPSNPLLTGFALETIALAIGLLTIAEISHRVMNWFIKTNTTVSNNIDVLNQKQVELSQNIINEYQSIDKDFIKQISKQGEFARFASEVIKIYEFTAHDPPATDKKIGKLLAKWKLDNSLQANISVFIKFISSESSIEFIQKAAEYYAIDQILNNPNINGREKAKPLFGFDLVIDGDQNPIAIDLMSGILPLQGIKALKAKVTAKFVDFGFFMTEVLRFTKMHMQIDDRMQVLREDVLKLDLEKESVSVLRMKNLSAIVGSDKISDQWLRSIREAIKPGGQLLALVTMNSPHVDPGDEYYSDIVVRKMIEESQWTYEIGYLTDDEQYYTTDKNNTSHGALERVVYRFQKPSTVGGISNMLQVTYGFAFSWLHGDRAAAKAFYAKNSGWITTAIFSITATIVFALVFVVSIMLSNKDSSTDSSFKQVESTIQSNKSIKQLLSNTINNNAIRDISGFVAKLFNDYQVVMLGDSHPDRACKEMARFIIEQNKPTHLVMEFNEKRIRPAINHYIETQDDWPLKVAIFDQYTAGYVEPYADVNGFLAIIKEAIDNDVTLVFPDPRVNGSYNDPGQATVDTQLTNSIIDIASADLQAKIFVYWGGQHISTGLKDDGTPYMGRQLADQGQIRSYSIDSHTMLPDDRDYYRTIVELTIEQLAELKPPFLLPAIPVLDSIRGHEEIADTFGYHDSQLFMPFNGVYRYRSLEDLKAGKTRAQVLEKQRLKLLAEVEQSASIGGISHMLQVAYGWLVNTLFGLDRSVAEAQYASWAPEIETFIFGAFAGLYYWQSGDLYTSTLIFWAGFISSHYGSTQTNVRLARWLSYLNLAITLLIVTMFNLETNVLAGGLLFIAWITHRIMNYYAPAIVDNYRASLGDVLGARAYNQSQPFTNVIFGHINDIFGKNFNLLTNIEFQAGDKLDVQGHQLRPGQEEKSITQEELLPHQVNYVISMPADDLKMLRANKQEDQAAIQLLADKLDNQLKAYAYYVKEQALQRAQEEMTETYGDKVETMALKDVSRVGSQLSAEAFFRNPEGDVAVYGHALWDVLNQIRLTVENESIWSRILPRVNHLFKGALARMSFAVDHAIMTMTESEQSIMSNIISGMNITDENMLGLGLEKSSVRSRLEVVYQGIQGNINPDLANLLTLQEISDLADKPNKVYLQLSAKEREKMNRVIDQLRDQITHQGLSATLDFIQKHILNQEIISENHAAQFQTILANSAAAKQEYSLAPLGEGLTYHATSVTHHVTVEEVTIGNKTMKTAVPQVLDIFSLNREPITADSLRDSEQVVGVLPFDGTRLKIKKFSTADSRDFNRDIITVLGQSPAFQIFDRLDHTGPIAQAWYDLKYAANSAEKSAARKALVRAIVVVLKETSKASDQDITYQAMQVSNQLFSNQAIMGKIRQFGTYITPAGDTMDIFIPTDMPRGVRYRLSYYYYQLPGDFNLMRDLADERRRQQLMNFTTDSAA